MDPSHPQPLASLPPSPTIEEDLTKAGGWDDESNGHAQQSHALPVTSQDRKGKGRALEPTSPNLYEEEQDDGGSDAGLEPSGPNGANYPPTTEEAEETRKVEEHLRRWEQAERERRRQVRESAQSATPSESVLGNVARRASLLWSGRSSGSRPTTAGAVLAGRSSIDEVPLSAVPASPGLSPRPSTEGRMDSARDGVSLSRPRPQSQASVQERLADIVKPKAKKVSILLEPQAQPTESPFADPPFSSASDDEDASGASGAMMDPSSPESPQTPTARRSTHTHTHTNSANGGADATPKRPVLQASSLSYAESRPPPPAPFDIPPPRTPPPRVGTPHASRPPEPHPRDEAQEREVEADVEAEEEHDGKVHRWWTDWLCGCGPGTEHDGQAGRTNPFE